MAAASPAGAPSPSLSPTKAEAEPCLALFLFSTPLTHLYTPSSRSRRHREAGRRAGHLALPDAGEQSLGILTSSLASRSSAQEIDA
jgi:hypothetical protein